MPEQILVKLFRYDPSSDKPPGHQTYTVPFVAGMSAMDALDYIYQNLDGSIAYYDHAACALGACGRCTGKVNGKPGLLCRIPVEGDIRIEPVTESKVIRDLVVRRGE